MKARNTFNKTIHNDILIFFSIAGCFDVEYLILPPDVYLLSSDHTQIWILNTHIKRSRKRVKEIMKRERVYIILLILVSFLTRLVFTFKYGSVVDMESNSLFWIIIFFSFLIIIIIINK